MPRTALLTGSLPGRTPAEAMAAACAILGRFLACLPGGETAGRRNWVAAQVIALGGVPGLVNTNPAADWGANGTPVYELADGASLTAEAVYAAMPYALDALAEHSLYQALGLPGVVPAFQAGVPALHDQLICSVGADRAADPAYTFPFADATAAQLSVIAGLGPDVIIQLESVLMLAAMAAERPENRAALADTFAAELAQVPPGRYGLHLCAGDFGHRHLTDLGQCGLGPAVQLAAAAARAIPGLEYVHLPAGYGRIPPSKDQKWYGPLAQADLPDGVALALGYVHEGRSLDELRQIRDMAEEAAGRELWVAAPCGLGRRDTDAEAVGVMRAMAELCED